MSQLHVSVVTVLKVEELSEMQGRDSSFTMAAAFAFIRPCTSMVLVIISFPFSFFSDEIDSGLCQFIVPTEQQLWLILLTICPYYFGT